MKRRKRNDPKVAAKSDGGSLHVALTQRASQNLILVLSSLMRFSFRSGRGPGVRHTGSSAAKTELYPILSISLPSARFSLFKAKTFKPRHVASRRIPPRLSLPLLLQPPPPSFPHFPFKLSFPPPTIPFDATPEATSFLPSVRTHTPGGLIGPREKRGKEGKHNETREEVERKGSEEEEEEEVLVVEGSLG